MNRPASPPVRFQRRLNTFGFSAMLALAAPGSAPLLAATGKAETAVLAGGCFWGVEAVFEHVKGVHDVVSGYAGGNPVSLSRPGADSSDFAETVRITYDPRRISYGKLLEIFMTVAHDPTQVDRQGPDVGRRYRSAIFPRDQAQRQAAQQFLARLKSSNRFGRPIATRIEGGGFKIAEAAHQDYVRRHPKSRYVVVNDLPKLAHLKRRYPRLWKS